MKFFNFKSFWWFAKKKNEPKFHIEEIKSPSDVLIASDSKNANQPVKNIDEKRRNFLKALGVIGLSALGLSALPKKADALGIGGAPPNPAVNLRNRSNVKINPATEEGKAVLKKTVTLTESGVILTPTTGKMIHLYNTKFSLTADMTSVSFRFTPSGTDFEKYMSPKAGGLYGIKNHPNYITGGINEALHCIISGTGSVQVNIDYVEFP